MEYWDILDKKGNRTGKTIVRGKRRLAKGEYHLVVHIWIVNDNGNFLLQRRSNDRLLMPGEWAATGGAALSGESSRHAALRELSEELGIKVNRRELMLVQRLIRRYSINDVWAVKFNGKIEDLKLQEEEVAEVKWASPSTLKEMIKKGSFHNYGEEYSQVIYSISELLNDRRVSNID